MRQGHKRFRMLSKELLDSSSSRSTASNRPRLPSVFQPGQVELHACLANWDHPMQAYHPGVAERVPNPSFRSRQLLPPFVCRHDLALPEDLA